MIIVITPSKNSIFKNMAMVREIVDGHWNIARHLIQSDSALLYAVVQGHDLTREEMMSREALDRILQHNTWCYVIHRVPGGFEEVTYHKGVPKKVIQVSAEKIRRAKVSAEADAAAEAAFTWP